jgi:hypothetical protein
MKRDYTGTTLAPRTGSMTNAERECRRRNATLDEVHFLLSGLRDATN